MAFGDPFQQQHMMAGVKAALGSPNTPAQLRPHLNARLGGAMKPIKTVVGSMAAKPIKTLVGNTAAPVIKTTVGNTAKPVVKTFITTKNADTNLGKSVGSMPPPAQGPPNPVLDWAKASGNSTIQAGGMGPAAKTTTPGVPRRKRGPFFGG